MRYIIEKMGGISECEEDGIVHIEEVFKVSGVPTMLFIPRFFPS